MENIVAAPLFQSMPLPVVEIVFLGIASASVFLTAVFIVEGWRKDNIDLVFYSVKVSAIAWVIVVCGVVEGTFHVGRIAVMIPCSVLMAANIMAFIRCRVKMKELSLVGSINACLKDKSYFILESGRRPLIKMRGGGKLFNIVAVGLLPIDEERCVITFASAAHGENWASADECAVKQRIGDDGDAWDVLSLNRKMCRFDYKEVMNELKDYFENDK